jgi:cellulose synthase/poly-beta-1,6-N-acetylglucosamine synthase-like glycosyltransferase
MNAGLKRATGEIVLCFDADYYPQQDIVEKLVREFVDPSVGAVQGRPVVWNEAQNAVTRLVTLERIGGYRVDQEARDNLGSYRNLEARSGALGEAFWKIWAVLTSPC